MQPKSARNAPRTPKAFPPFPILKAKPTSAPHSYCHESDLIFGGNRYKRPNNRTKDCGCETGKASQKQFFFSGNGPASGIAAIKSRSAKPF
jgi:hypothetical protein